jgi:dolichol-phosphate mannosyltransferase
VLISFIIPVFNEMTALPALLEKVLMFCADNRDLRFEIIVINDGSTDETKTILNAFALRDPRVKPVHLLINVGQQRSLVAGLDKAKGDAVIMMDGDGQHPVSCVNDMLKFWLSHPEIHVVQGVRQGAQKGIIKNALSFLFYRVVREMIPELRIIPGASDFRLLSRAAVNAIRQYDDRHRNLRILLSYLKLPTHEITYRVEKRLAGESKYSWSLMMELGLDGIFAFSWFPLRLAKWLAMSLFTAAIGFLVYAVGVWTTGGTAAGWTSLVGLITLLFSGVFVVLAFMGEYIKRIYEDVRGRPIYTIDDSSQLQRESGNDKPQSSDINRKEESLPR